MQMVREDIISVRLVFFFSLKQPQGLFYKGCKTRTRACVTALERVSLLAVHYPFCGWINGAIDQRQTCVSRRTDHSPTAGPDTGAPISTAAARMITDAWLGWAAEEPPPTPTSSDSLTLIGEGAVAGSTGESRGSVQQGRNLTGMKHRCKAQSQSWGHAQRETNAPQRRQYNDVHLKGHRGWSYRLR